jgi:hypothetical protein
MAWNPPLAAMTPPKSERSLKVAFFTVRVSREQALRGSLVARWLKCRSVASWLEEMADGACERLGEVAADAARRGGKL